MGLFFFSLSIPGPGPLKPEDADLLREVELLELTPRPVEMSEDLGRRLLQRMVEKNGFQDPVRQHYFVQNVRKGFYDPHRNQGKGKGKQKGKQGTGQPAVRVAWEVDANFHLGYLPLNLEGLALSENFQQVLDNLARKAYAALRGRVLSFKPEHVHILFWCNHGCHRSVGFCRLMQIVATTWGWE